jgi:hypothetical protein
MSSERANFFNARVADLGLPMPLVT